MTTRVMRFTIVHYYDEWQEIDAGECERVEISDSERVIAKFYNEGCTWQAEAFISGLEYSLGKIFVDRISKVIE